MGKYTDAEKAAYNLQKNYAKKKKSLKKLWLKGMRVKFTDFKKKEWAKTTYRDNHPQPTLLVYQK